MDLITPRHSPRTPRHDHRPRRLSARGHIQAPVRIKDAAERAAPPILPAHRTPRQSSPRSRAASNPACAAEPPPNPARAAEPSPILLCAAEPSPTQPAQQSRSPSPTRPKPASLCTDRRSRNVVPLQPAARTHATSPRVPAEPCSSPISRPGPAMLADLCTAPRRRDKIPLAAPTEPSLPARPRLCTVDWVGGTRSGIRSRQASPEAEPSAGTITVVIRRVVPGVQAWRACSMLIAAEIQRSSTRNRQAWSSAECELMPH